MSGCGPLDRGSNPRRGVKMEVINKESLDDYRFYCPSCKQDTLFHSQYSFHRTEIVSCSCCKKEYSKDTLYLETLKKLGVKMPKNGLVDIAKGIIEFFI